MANGYAGDISPKTAWDLIEENDQALLVDVRTDAEWRFVGVPTLEGLGREVGFAQWVTNDGQPNQGFVGELAALGLRPGDERPIAFLCRSGQRSIAAAQAATAAGFGPAYNILEGFEGGLNAAGHRGETGWRAADLPWKQS